MKKNLLLSSLFQLLLIIGFAQTKVDSLLTENRKNPVGLDVAQPRFSWQLINSGRDIKQTAYEINVLDGKNKVWQSGRVMSDSSVHVAYKGRALQSGSKYTWQVRVWDNTGKPSAWSAPAFFYTALFNTSGWKAKWIGPGYIEDSVMRPSPLFRKEFKLSKKIQSAVAYITAHGMYEAAINGQRVGDAYLTPGWTVYNKRLQYQMYDVTNMLKNGNNAVGVTLGNGWYRGIIGFANNINYFGKDIALLMQFDITYTDGSKESIITDDTWKSTDKGPVRYAEIYNGETYDARKEVKGWNEAGFNDKGWSGVKLTDASFDVLTATYNEPVKQHEIIKPVKIITTPKGEKVIDFGQNLVGWVVMKAKGNSGDTVTLSHAEVLDKEGNVYLDNLRAAKAQDKYVLTGEEHSYHPHFTWQGFRYCRVEGLQGELNPEDFEAVVLYSDMEPTGTFSTNNPLINQLQHNIQWGQRGNFLDVPTDCPQRDERLGWTGDAQAFSRTASFNFNVNDFFSKWLKDLEADQIDGKVPFVIPNVLGAGAANSCGWADVATIVPWDMYLAYGDTRLLAQQYGSMKAYVESIRKVAKDDLWNTGFHFGDWLFYRPFDDNDGSAAVTDKYLIAQCFYAHSTQLLINTAQVLGNTQDVNEYTALLQRIKDAFNKEYVTANGRLVSGTQTAYVLALNFDMLPEAQRKQAAERLAENVKRYNNHLTTGFLGTPYLCHVLTRFGYDSVAYKLLLQKNYPSWLYPVTMGATTIWERWDGQKPDSTFQTPGMNSFNHYAYGAIGDWMYRKMAGLDTYEDGAGYKHIKIMPHIGGGFTQAKASLKTYYGTASSGWVVNGNTITIDVAIPPNTTATIYIPAKDASAVTESGKALQGNATMEDGYVVVNVGSGTYQFTSANALVKN
ncbi:family 78 glycoside hydrolase catalytic domain [Parafilimonas sp.]|uniref:family 78 glycoside hydrolase catalytic domain n=1 Tax=Parafilimonas sp. TaxID=1969739 RepID=UPI0039E2831E